MVFCGGDYYYGDGDPIYCSFRIIRGGATILNKHLSSFDCRHGLGDAHSYGAATHISDTPIKVGDTLQFYHRAAGGSCMVLGC